MKVIVWGLATGRGSTEGAARGALTWREYEGEEKIPKEDWLHIITIQREKG